MQREILKVGLMRKRIFPDIFCLCDSCQFMCDVTLEQEKFGKIHRKWRFIPNVLPLNVLRLMHYQELYFVPTSICYSNIKTLK